jgi:hypothetical protein
MATSLSALAASEHTADLHRAASGRGAGRAGLRRRRSTAAVSGARPAATVRFAHPDEAGTLRCLAQLDDAPELAGEILVATIDTDVVAALSLHDGRVVANPFVLTSDAVELLRRSATALTGHRRRRWRSALRPQLAWTARAATRD